MSKIYERQSWVRQSMVWATPRKIFFCPTSWILKKWCVKLVFSVFIFNTYSSQISKIIVIIIMIITFFHTKWVKTAGKRSWKLTEMYLYNTGRQIKLFCPKNHRIKKHEFQKYFDTLSLNGGRDDGKHKLFYSTSMLNYCY